MGHYLVLGAAGGVGKAVVRALADAGHSFSATVLSEAEAADLSTIGLHADIAVLDLAETDRIGGSLDVVLAKLPHLDGVINCAAIAPTGPAETTGIATFRSTFEINCLANVAIAQAALPKLRESRGRLILVSSMAGRVALPFMAAYSMSKHGLEAFADCLRMETLDQGVDVVLVQPGTIRTAMAEGQRLTNARKIGQLTTEEEALYGKFYRGFQKAVSQVDDGVGVSAEEVAELILTIVAVDRPDARYVIGVDAEQLIAANATLTPKERDATFAAFMTAS